MSCQDLEPGGGEGGGVSGIRLRMNWKVTKITQGAGGFRSFEPFSDLVSYPYLFL